MLKTGSLEKLDNGIRHCRRCERCLTRMYAVPGEGSANARIVLFGEAPGKNEDITGRPFVGRAGKYLDKIFREHKVDREEIFITSILKCYHPKPPKKSQIVSCLGIIWHGTAGDRFVRFGMEHYTLYCDMSSCRCHAISG